MARYPVKTQIDRGGGSALRYLHGQIFTDFQCQRVEESLICQRDSPGFQPARRI